MTHDRLRDVTVTTASREGITTHPSRKTRITWRRHRRTRQSRQLKTSCSMFLRRPTSTIPSTRSCPSSRDPTIKQRQANRGLNPRARFQQSRNQSWLIQHLQVMQVSSIFIQPSSRKNNVKILFYDVFYWYSKRYITQFLIATSFQKRKSTRNMKHNVI